MFFFQCLFFIGNYGIVYVRHSVAFSPRLGPPGPKYTQAKYPRFPDLFLTFLDLFYVTDQPCNIFKFMFNVLFCDITNIYQLSNYFCQKIVIAMESSGLYTNFSKLSWISHDFCLLWAKVKCLMCLSINTINLGGWIYVYSN